MMEHVQTHTITTTEAGGRELSTTCGPGQESSVEIAQNAKGEPRITVKIYHADPGTAAQQAIDIYRQTVLKMKGED